MGYKHEELAPGPILRGTGQPNFLIKIIPHVDGGPRICELVRYRWQDVSLTLTEKKRLHDLVLRLEFMPAIILAMR